MLSIGHCCMDDIYHVLKYPKEDSTVGSRTQHNRCTSQNWARGGNASNNATIWACLGEQAEFCGTLANDHLLGFFTEDMTELGIIYSNCPIIPGVGRAPSSVVICSEETGSRTIVHSTGDLPELSVTDFQKLNLDNYSWIHFEGRNEAKVSEMIKLALDYNARNSTEEKSVEIQETYGKVRLPISVEVEKCREGLIDLIPLAHVVFVGKDYASWTGAKTCTDAVSIMLEKVAPGTIVICPWGEDGAAFGSKIGNATGNNSNKEIVKIDAFPPTKLIDSLGAGDTFVASTILALSRGMKIDSSVRFGCRMASEKLGMYGFRGLKEKKDILLEFSK